MESKRYRKLVAIAAPRQVCILIPVSIWEKNKNEYENCLKQNYPKYPQPVNKTYLYLHDSLKDYLENPDKLYFEQKDDHFIIYSEKKYNEKNLEEREKLDKLYEML